MLMGAIAGSAVAAHLPWGIFRKRMKEGYQKELGAASEYYCSTNAGLIIPPSMCWMCISLAIRRRFSLLALFVCRLCRAIGRAFSLMILRPIMVENQKAFRAWWAFFDKVGIEYFWKPFKFIFVGSWWLVGIIGGVITATEASAYCGRL